MVKLSFFMEIKINCALLVSVKYKKEGRQCTIALIYGLFLLSIYLLLLKGPRFLFEV